MRRIDLYAARRLKERLKEIEEYMEEFLKDGASKPAWLEIACGGRGSSVERMVLTELELNALINEMKLRLSRIKEKIAAQIIAEYEASAAREVLLAYFAECKSLRQSAKSAGLTVGEAYWKIRRAAEKNLEAETSYNRKG